MNRTLTASAIVAIAALMAAPAFAATAAATTTAKTPVAAAAATTKVTTPAKPAMAAPAKPAMATTPAKPAVLTFAKIDANHDGKVSMDELKKYFPSVTKAEFDKYDADKSGDYNKAELAAYVKAQQPAKAPMATMAPAKPAAATPAMAPVKK